MHECFRNRKGITLMELVLVFILLGILSALTVPNLLRSNERWPLRSTAYMIANDIRRVQRLSVQECALYNFELHTKQFYYILPSNDPMASNIKTVYLNSKITSVSSTLYNPDYGGTKDGYRILKFSYLGSPNQAGEIILKTSSGDSMKLTIDVATGRVKVYD